MTPCFVLVPRFPSILDVVSGEQGFQKDFDKYGAANAQIVGVSVDTIEKVRSVMEWEISDLIVFVGTFDVCTVVVVRDATSSTKPRSRMPWFFGLLCVLRLRPRSLTSCMHARVV